MTYNIMGEYINFTRKFIRDFMREYFKEGYSRHITDEYIEVYIDARYCNFGGNENQRIFYRRIYTALQKKCEELTYNAENEKEIIKIKNMLEIYQYIFYIDFVREIKIDFKKFIKQICEKRTSKFELKEEDGIEEKIERMVKIFRERKMAYLEKFDSSDFELIVKKYPLVKNIYNVDLKYNFKIPYLFSDRAIEEVYNENVINEDKIIIQYLMLAILNLKNIQVGNFLTQYLVDFPLTLFGKGKKLEQVLRIINAQAIQDKVNLKIQFKDFIEYKDKIYGLMQDGFRFVMVLDDTFKVSIEEIRKLSMFKYIILSTKLDKYNRIKEYEEHIDNLLIDEG